MNTSKAGYKRYAKVGGGGMTCPCCMGKAAKPVFKKIGRKHYARITDMLVEDEINPEITVPVNAQTYEREMEYLLIEQDIEQKRYHAWAFNEEYPNENRGRYYDCTYAGYDKDRFEVRGRSRFNDYDHSDYDPSRWAHIQDDSYNQCQYDTQRVLNIGQYEVNRWNTDIYHVEVNYNFIGSVRLAQDMTWHVDYVPQKGEQTHYEFEYLDTSIEAAAQMLIILHKLEVDTHDAT